MKLNNIECRIKAKEWLSSVAKMVGYYEYHYNDEVKNITLKICNNVLDFLDKDLDTYDNLKMIIKEIENIKAVN